MSPCRDSRTARHAGVLGGYQVGFPQNAQRAQRDVLHVADGGRDYDTGFGMANRKGLTGARRLAYNAAGGESGGDMIMGRND